MFPALSPDRSATTCPGSSAGTSPDRSAGTSRGYRTEPIPTRHIYTSLPPQLFIQDPKVHAMVGLDMCKALSSESLDVFELVIIIIVEMFLASSARTCPGSSVKTFPSRWDLTNISTSLVRQLAGL